ncbi:uncharacterized protein LOC126555315 [Aphis gossypii]|uniref:uncharacterized protein LOC126555315 n=1 Tax=Aphis gossypii TaxID=80765 RepID=UPI0021596FE3|nr:uncharacterized protein LOC126555315 [Aphis gossypii]
MDHVWESYQFDFGIVCGDFNLPNIRWSNRDSGLEYDGSVTDKVRQIGDQYEALHFEQKNNVPNISNSFLDLVFTNNKFVKVEESSEPLLPCDMHHPALTISCTCPLDIPVLNNSHSFHDFKHGNYVKANDDLRNINWAHHLSSLTTEQSAKFLQNSLLHVIDHCVPLLTFRNSSFPPWVTKSLKDLLVKKKQVHKIFKTFGGFNNYRCFSLLRSQCKFVSKKLYRSYTCKMQEQLCNNPRSFWDYARKAQGSQNIPEKVHLDSISASGDQVSDLFASYFFSVYVKPRVISDAQLNLITTKQFSFLPSSITITPDEVSAAFESLATTRGSGPDGISAIFLYRCRNHLILPICAIFNKSLAEGIFPSVWKCSRVTPILKSGDPTDVTNYRPISGLPFLGKMFESIVLKRIQLPLLSTISVDQHGFFPGWSTSTNPIDFVSFVHVAFSARRQVDVVYTDFSKAFDSIDHNTLIYVLDRLGIGDPLLTWL